MLFQQIILIFGKKQPNMKTIICGPPHSGKSVLISNLVSFMPSDSYQRINANGDGEGTWSNYLDQQEVARVRIKTGNTPEEFASWEKRIRMASQSIVLVDIGGRLQDDKGPLFDVADNFIVLSSDPLMTEGWKSFGEAHGCLCLATVDSVLEGEHQILEETPYLRARISGLVRGSNHKESVVLRALADLLVRTSGYCRTELIDFCDIGREAGCVLEWKTREGVPVTHLDFRTEAASTICELLRRRYRTYSRYRIYNLKTNWVAAITSYCLGDGDITSVEFFDDWTSSFIRPSILRKTTGKTVGVICSLEETEDAVFLNMRSAGLSLNPVHFTDYTIPVIDENKTLYLSGRFPTWFTVSVLGSYSSREQYVLQPGNHYICVKSDKQDRIGQIKAFDG